MRATGAGRRAPIIAAVAAMWAPGLLAQTVTVGFDEVDASGGILRANLARADDPVTDYLARNGIEIVDQLPEGRDLYVVIDARNDYGFVAPSHPNVFSQMGSNGLISYRFRFKSPLSAFSLTRARLRAGPTGITHPIWRATAIDKEGRRGEPVGEGWIAEYSTVPERIFTMPLPPGGEISEVEIAADNRSIAAFSSVVLDDLVLTHPDNAPKTP